MRRIYYEKNAERLDEMLEIHDNIVNAIKMRDAEKVSQALKADIDNVIEQLYNLNNVDDWLSLYDRKISIDLGNKGKRAIMLGANTMLFKNWSEESHRGFACIQKQHWEVIF